MNSLYDVRFSIFIIIDILGLCLCSFLLKKFVKKFPNNLIPLINVIISTITTILYLDYHFKNKAPFLFLAVMGVIDGLAATGLHQLIKQTAKYIFIKKKLRNFNKDKRKIIS